LQICLGLVAGLQGGCEAAVWCSRMCLPTPLNLCVMWFISYCFIQQGLEFCRHLWKLFAIDPADYMLVIYGNDTLRELSSPGKTDSFFYLTQDDHFMTKTVRKSEVKVTLHLVGLHKLEQEQ
jgi:hypothetical protein